MDVFMKNVIATRPLSLPKGRLLTVFIFAAFFALSACDDSSSAGDDDDGETSALSSSAKVTEPAEVTDGSSDSKGGPSLAGTSTKSSDSNSSGNDTKSSSSSMSKVESSSSAVTLAIRCKTETEDNCEYGILLDERDGQEYKTVKIGNQWWMAQNLNYEIAGSRCYERNESNCARSGRFYTWAAAMDSIAAFSDNGKGCGKNLTCSPAYPVRGICPGGWHLPSKDEWNILIETVGGASAAGKTLRTTTGWLYKENGSDAYSFSALPVGYSTHGDFGTHGYSANFWSSTENGTSAAYAMQMVFGEEARLFNHFKYYDVPVRCVKDSD